MIAGAHVILFAEDAARARAFIGDVLGLAAVDAGHGWLIFALPPAEVAVHPAAAGEQRHEVYLMCHDIEEAVRDLQERGAQLTAPIDDQGWGRIARFAIPGAGEIGIYEPRHPSPLAGF